MHLLHDVSVMHAWCTQVAATCKHFAAYSLEAAEGFTRQTFDAHVNERHALCPAKILKCSSCNTRTKQWPVDMTVMLAAPNCLVAAWHNYLVLLW